MALGDFCVVVMKVWLDFVCRALIFCGRQFWACLYAPFGKEPFGQVLSSFVQVGDKLTTMLQGVNG